MGFYKELGDRLEKWLKEKIKVVDTKVESIAKYHKYVNTELDSCFCGLASNYTPVVGAYVPFTKVSGSFEVNNGRVIIKPRQRIQINICLNYHDGSGAISNILYHIKDCTNNKVIATFQPINNNNTYEYNDSQQCQYTNDTDVNCEIGLYIEAVYTSDTIMTYSTMTVQEINRQIVIDPVEHVNESHGIEDTPVGHIISHMGTVAPKHYLICDGTEYNIMDYPYLAQHFIDQFGSVNYFGGDGSTTFCVPDLRGEFLRGTGTALRNTGSGGDVGEHQEPTEIPSVNLSPDNYIYMAASGSACVRNQDISILSPANMEYTATKNGTWGINSIVSMYTSRPTNTSVLYCIKYEPTYFMNTYNTNYMQPSLYSEEERVVGCWVNGKPLYRRCCKLSEISDYTDYINCVISNIKNDNYKPLVPILTSRVSDDYDTIYNTESNDSWSYNAFDGGTSVPELSWYSNSLGAYLGIHFKTKKVIVTKIELVQEIATPCYFKDYQFQASNNGVDWIVLGSFSTDKFVAGNVVENDINSNEAYEYYRVYFTSQGTGSVSAGVSVQNMQFYGYEEKTNVYEYTKTTDEENSFTESMLKESYVKLDSTCTDEELQQAIADIVEEINADPVIEPEQSIADIPMTIPELYEEDTPTIIPEIIPDEESEQVVEPEEVTPEVTDEPETEQIEVTEGGTNNESE